MNRGRGRLLLALACLLTFLITVGGTPRGAQRTSASPEVAQVSGVVTDGRTGQPVSHAIVSLSASSPTGSTSRQQQCDALGRFVFQDVPAGTACELAAARPGYFPSQYDRGELAPEKNRFALAANQWVKDARVVLWRAGAISGRVLDERSEPLSGAYVRVLRRVPVGDQSVLAAGPVARTDDRGVYRVSNLAKGEYLVAVPSVQMSKPKGPSADDAAANPPGRKPVVATGTSRDGTTALIQSGYPSPSSRPGESPLVYEAQYYPGVRSASEAAFVTIDYGDDLPGVDFKLAAIPSRRVSGRVEAVAQTGNAISLRLIPAGSEGLGPGSEVATTKPDVSGRFCFLGVPSGRYTIEATPRLAELSVAADRASVIGSVSVGLPGSTGLVVAPAIGFPGLALVGKFGDSGSLWGRASVEVRDRDVSEVTVVLNETSVVEGVLQLDRDSTPPAHRYAALTAEPALDNGMLVMPSIDVAEADNPASPWEKPRRFAIRGLTPGRYFLRVGRGIAIRSALLNGTEYSDGPLAVSEGQALPGLVVTVTRETASVAGRVSDRTGQAPTRKAAVVYFPHDSSAWVDLGLAPSRVGFVEIDADGA